MQVNSAFPQIISFVSVPGTTPVVGAQVYLGLPEKLTLPANLRVISTGLLRAVTGWYMPEGSPLIIR